MITSTHLSFLRLVKKSSHVFLLRFYHSAFFSTNEIQHDKSIKIKGYKLHALRRIKKYLTRDKAKVLCNVFIKSQFSYAFIIWMFCRKMDYLKMEKIRYKALKILFDSNESVEDLFLHRNEVSIHQKQLR